ncbi:hypothetical protein [Leifsonia sp. A12D58]|uniref:hypothetical protein n=1 Tax=Leifsonia sp. A12D58 TaxID=3397674 RepID=UPI0039E08CFB
MFQRGYDPEADAAAGAADSTTPSRSWRARRASAPVFPSHDPAARQPQPSGQSSGRSDLRFRRPETTDAAAGYVMQDDPDHSGEVVQREAARDETVQREAAQEYQTEAWDPDQPTQQRRNPFIVALWIVGIGLIVGGIAFQWWAASLSPNYSGEEDQIPIEVILQQIAWTGAPAVSTVGGLTLVILIAWRAANWTSHGSAADVHDAEARS